MGRAARLKPSDLDGNFLVITATDSPEVNTAVYRGAVERNILCNSVDDIPNCDFFFGSVVSRGELQIAISTGRGEPGFRAAAAAGDRRATAAGPGAMACEPGRTAARGAGDASAAGGAQTAAAPTGAAAGVRIESCPSRELARVAAGQRAGRGRARVAGWGRAGRS